jgi:hypothetical protein
MEGVQGGSGEGTQGRSQQMTVAAIWQVRARQSQDEYSRCSSHGCHAHRGHREAAEDAQGQSQPMVVQR